MTEISHVVNQSDGVVTDSTDSWTSHTNKRVDVNALNASTDYLVGMFAQIGGSSTAADDFQFRIRSETATLTGSEARIEPRRSSTTSGTSYGWVGVYTTSSTPETDRDLRLQTNSDGINDCYLGDFYGFALSLGDLDAADYETSEDLTSNANVASGSWTNGASITIGDGSSDWLVFSSSHWLIDAASDSIRFRIDAGGTAHGEIQLEGEDTAEEYCVATLAFLSAPASQTVQAQIRTTSGSNDCDRTFIGAIRLDAFEDHAGVRDTTATAITTVDTDTVSGTLTHTVSTPSARNWVFFGLGINDVGDNDKRTHRRIEDSSLGSIAGNTTDHVVQNGDTDEVPMMLLGELSSVADAASLDIDYIVQEEADVTPNPTIDETTIVGFSWDIDSATQAVVSDFQEWTSTAFLSSVQLSQNVVSDFQEFTVTTYDTVPGASYTLDSDLTITIEVSGSSTFFVDGTDDTETTTVTDPIRSMEITGFKKVTDITSGSNSIDITGATKVTTITGATKRIDIS